MLTALAWVLAALPFAAAVLLGIALPLVAIRLARSLGAGLVLVALMFALDAAFIGRLRLSVGVNLYLDDLGYALLAAVALARWLTGRGAALPRWMRAAWAVWALIFVAALGLGLAQHGTTAGVHAREYFYALAAAGYFMSFELDERAWRQLVTTMTAMAVLLLVVAAWRWLVLAAGWSEWLPLSGAFSVDGPLRVIPSGEALLLAQVLVLGVFFASAGRAAFLARVLAPLLLAAIVALQHRSVWVAALAGVLVALAFWRRDAPVAAPRAAEATSAARPTRVRPSRFAQGAVLVVVVTAAALPFVASDRLGTVGEQVGRSAATAVAGQGTVHARLQDWQQTLTQWVHAGARAVLVGEGFGRDTARIVFDEAGERRLVRFGAHNHYVAVLTDTGLAGLVALGTVFAAALVGLWRLARDGDAAAHALLVLVVMQLVYYIPYGADAWQYVLLGCALARVAARRGLAPRAPGAAPRRAEVVAWP